MVTFNEAEARCKKLGGALASVRSDEQNRGVRALLHGNVAAMWIGLHERGRREHDYIWTNGQKPTYTHWQRGEPNNHQGHDEECV